MNNVISLDTVRRRKTASNRVNSEEAHRVLKFRRRLRPEELLLQRLHFGVRVDCSPPLNPEVLGGAGW